MMIALHISIFNGTPYIWSEGSQVGALKDLQTAVKAIDLDIKVLKSNSEFLTVWLPSYKNIPIPSSSLIGAEPDKKEKACLKSFSVLARPLKIEEVIKLASIAEGGNIFESQVISSGEQWLSELSNEDFSKLIRLESEALGE